MINKDNLEAEPLLVSLKGRRKKDQSWILFDHFKFQDDQLFLIGLDLENNPAREKVDDIIFSQEQLDYVIDYVQTQLKELKNALNALETIKNKL